MKHGGPGRQPAEEPHAMIIVNSCLTMSKVNDRLSAKTGGNSSSEIFSTSYSQIIQFAFAFRFFFTNILFQVLLYIRSGFVMDIQEKAMDIGGEQG